MSNVCFNQDTSLTYTKSKYLHLSKHLRYKGFRLVYLRPFPVLHGCRHNKTEVRIVSSPTVEQIKDLQKWSRTEEKIVWTQLNLISGNLRMSSTPLKYKSLLKAVMIKIKPKL